MAERDDGTERVHRCGEIEVDEALRQVRRAGSVVAIEPKPFDLLVYLIRQRHRVVSRDELMRALWPDVVVSEATLSSAVRRAREVLAPQRHLIEGVRKVGYRFAGEIDRHATASVPQRRAVFVAEELMGPAATQYIGRSRELAELGAQLDCALAGHGTLLAIAGEPGIGKTRTLGELIHRARDRQAEVLVGRCLEGEGGQAFWPWVQIFRSFVAQRDRAELAADLGAESADLARLTAAVLAPGDVVSLADPEMMRARLYDAAVVVLRRAAQRRPLLVVLDDLHWADRASLTLLAAVARQLADLPLVVAVTYRPLEVEPDHPLASLLAGLRREELVQSTTLEGLTRSEALLLLQAVAGATVDGALADVVFAATEGNPFFTLEYWRDLEEAGVLARSAASWAQRGDAPARAVPAGVAEIIDRRLRRLSPACVRLLTIGAVLGREFHYDLLNEVSTTEPGETIELLDAAAGARVIEEVEGSTGGYRFAHALIRQVLYERPTALRRAALHRYVGEAIEKRSTAPNRTTVAELAHHFLLAAAAGGARRAIAYAERAAADATQACAYDAAVQYLDQAVGLAAGLAGAGESPDQWHHCELQLSLAEALGRAGDGARLRVCCERGAGLARAIPAPALLARAAIGMACSSTVEDEEAVRLCEEALSVLPADEVRLRARLQATLARTLYLFDGTSERRRQLCGEARATAARSGDHVVAGEVLADCLEAEFNTDGLAEQDDLVAALRREADASDDTRLRLLGQAWEIVNLMRRGRLKDARHHLDRFTTLASELRQPRFLYYAAAFDAALLLARGRLAEAEARSAEALRLGLRIDAVGAAWFHWAQLHHLRREQGRFVEFLGEDLALRVPPGSMAVRSFQRSYRWATPHVFSELGREAEAKVSFETLISEGLDGLPGDNARNTRIPALFSLADACATVGNAAAAAQIYDLARPYADQWHVLGWGSVVFASVQSMLGILCGVQERWDEATGHFEEALRQHQEQEAVCSQARTLYQYARMLVRRGDSERAHRRIDHGLGICAEYQLKGAEARLLRLRADESR